MSDRLGQMQAKIHGFKLGNFEIATIMDSKSVRDALHPNFGGNASADEVHALARANNIDTNRFEHPYTPVLIKTGKELVIKVKATPWAIVSLDQVTMGKTGAAEVHIKDALSLLELKKPGQDTGMQIRLRFSGN